MVVKIGGHLLDSGRMPCLWLVNRFPDRWHDNRKGQACIGGMVETSETELQK